MSLYVILRVYETYRNIPIGVVDIDGAVAAVVVLMDGVTVDRSKV